MGDPFTIVPAILQLLAPTALDQLVTKPLARTEQMNQQKGAEEEMDYQKQQYADMLKNLGTQDKIEGINYSDPVLASILGGGDVQTLAGLFAEMEKGNKTSPTGGLL